ncbi:MULTISPECIES: O-antigen ligase [unclassified Thioalkalivibrio]|uniref:O-antigen ligase family protein n=1 Tax=unclassified Thioalkalivibrio TaxID=2621013 RepID=UPI00036C3600|nr:MULTISPECIES: O-antigen ligase family protein [unclassified Thioalkalivibrio]
MSHYPPSAYASVPSRLADDRLALSAVVVLYLGAFFSPVSTSLGQLFQFAALIVGILFVRRHWSALRNSPLLWLPVGFALWVIIRTAMAALWEDPARAAEHWDEMTTWFKSAAVPVLIYGLALAATGRWLRHGIVVLGLLLVGYMIFFVATTSWSGTLEALHTSARQEPDLGFRTAALVLPGLAAGALFATIHMFSGISGPQDRRGTRIVTGVLLALFFCFFVAIMVASKSRNSWLTLIILLSVSAVFALWVFRSRLWQMRVPLLAGALTIMLGTGAITTYAWSAIGERWSETAETVQQTMALPFGGRVEDLAEDPVGIRVAYWAFGWERFLDRPLVGRGAADQRHLTDEYPIPPQLEGRTDTYHNSHIDILLRFGLVGYLLFAATILLILLEAWRRLQTPGAARTIALFTLGFVPAMAFWAMNAQIIQRFSVEHFYGLVLALMAASHFARLTSYPDERSHEDE